MGSKGGSTIGYWYNIAAHWGLGIGPIDAFLEFRGGDKTAWAGELTDTGTITINAPNLWGGKKDQGGIVSDVDVMFGRADQQPNSYLTTVFGDQQSAWRGFATLVFKGGKYGAMNPYPQAAAFKIRKIRAGWDEAWGGSCWYPEKAEIRAVAIEDGTAAAWGPSVPFESGATTEWGPTLYVFSDGRPVVASRDSATGPTWSPLGSTITIRHYASDRVTVAASQTWTVTDNTGLWYRARLASVSPDGDWQVLINDGAGYCFLAYRGAITWRIRPTESHSWAWASYTASAINFGADYCWAPNETDDGWHLFIGVHKNGDYTIYKFIVISADLGAVAQCTPGSVTTTAGGQGYWMALDRSGGLFVVNSDRQLIGYDTWLNSSFTSTIPDAVSTWAGFGYDGGYGLIAFVTHDSAAWTLDVYYASGGARAARFALPDFIDAKSVRVFFSDVGIYASAGNRFYFAPYVYASETVAMNPVHALYYARTHSAIGREPIANINDASYRAAADWYHAQQFGICQTEYDSSQESLAEFEQRLCTVMGASVSRSRVDGQWYIDIANGEYTLADLPIITDDDILDWSAQPSTLDGAINSVSVKYFDPATKEDITTPPVQALGLIDAFGQNHQVNEYTEIPWSFLAARVAQRDCRAACTPTVAFDLKLTRKAYTLRPNSYFRLQAPKRGIADMVCIVGEINSGTLKSGAISLKASQDIYSLPKTAYVEVEPGVDTRPSQTPVPVTLQAAFEAPYIELSQRLSRADMLALPDDAGYLLTVAAQPGAGLNYDMTVADAGGIYDDRATGEWCPTALTTTLATEMTTAIVLTAGSRLAQVDVGTAALWDSEIVRVDAIDANTGALTLGRGCADTVRAGHAAGSRLWFYDAWSAQDELERTSGETLDVKLLTNTGSQQLNAALASALSVTLAERQVRPYPPAGLTLNGEAYPATVYATADLAWAHRDRVSQADTLVDATLASIGPEAGTTYTARWYIDDALVEEQTGITGITATYAPTSDGALRVEVIALRDGYESWQAASATATYYVSPLDTYADEAADTYTDETGNIYKG